MYNFRSGITLTHFYRYKQLYGAYVDFDDNKNY